MPSFLLQALDPLDQQLEALVGRTVFVWQRHGGELVGHGDPSEQVREQRPQRTAIHRKPTRPSTIPPTPQASDAWSRSSSCCARRRVAC
jgi:hypothetical protein